LPPRYAYNEAGRTAAAQEIDKILGTKPAKQAIKKSYKKPPRKK
jgi:hypothetical protein|tara:strand:- start:186 stop:317 length:132 start_codon:yes stop_codon:yes gene_type:complete